MSPAQIVFEVFVTAVAAFGQGEAKHPAFEVASIRPSAPTQLPRNKLTGPTVSILGRPLTNLVALAYPEVTSEYQLVAPSWLGIDRFDITAKKPDGASDSEVPLMLQSLLAERFKLRIHWESKQQAGYELAVGKNGPKLKASQPDAPTFTRLVLTPASKQRGFSSAAMTMDDVSAFLGHALESPVVNMTGIEGRYDVNLSYANDPALAGSDDLDLGAVFSALEQIGLRLEAKKVTLKVLVVDHVERTPTEN
jgi:uncharacterized protein (TIGR03435 family)